MHRHARLITMIASAGLSLVFIALILCTIWGAVTIKHSAARTLSAVTLSERYELLERQLSAEAALVRVHGFDPEGSGWNEERYAAVATEATLDLIAKSESPKDREIARATSIDHDRYLDVLLVLFSQIDNNAPDVATTFRHSVRISERILGRIDARASDQRTTAITLLADLAATQSFIVRTLILASILGVLLLGACCFVIVAYRRSIERARQLELTRLAQASLTDTLTGLGNHRAYQEDLERELARLQRQGGTLTLALIDIDNFKSVNDSKGHISGDRVLAALGALLSGLRKIDRSFRLGGDEFAVVLPHTELADAVAIMNRLRLDVPGALEGSTVSIGLSATSDCNVDAIALRAEADSALYAAKRLGRNNVMSYADAQEHSLVHSSEKQRAVRRLIDEGTLDVVFQPIWDVTAHAPLGFEALARPSARYGLAGPQEAFDIAEQMGLASSLDAVTLTAIFARAGELPPDTLLFVNIVPETIDSTLVAGNNLVQLAASAGLCPDRVVIELTERSMSRFDVIVREAKRLQSLGFRLALDDVGAGNAGLDVLRNLTVDFVKIDRMVVAQAMTDPVAHAIVSGIVDIARAMHSYVIAEGIETGDMLGFICSSVIFPTLRTGGAQGYLLGRPDTAPWNASYAQTKSLFAQIPEASPYSLRRAPSHTSEHTLRLPA